MDRMHDTSGTPPTEAELRFNILFVPETVGLLAPLVWSLLRCTDCCTFRLVNNGCSQAEAKKLEALRVEHERLEYGSLCPHQVIKHGEALSLLQQEERGRFFAFLDSDIFATAQFLPALLDELATASAVFACSNIWLEQGDHVMRPNQHCMSAVHHWLDDGRCVGSSHFAVYWNQDLNSVIRENHVDLRPYRWKSLPTLLRRKLAEANLEMAEYDTAKMINVLMLIEGRKSSFLQVAGLTHLGGISSAFIDYPKDGMLRSALRTLLPNPLRQLYYYSLYSKWIAGSEAKVIARRSARRLSTSASLVHVLAGLNEGDRSSAVAALSDNSLSEKTRRVIQKLMELEALGPPTSTSPDWTTCGTDAV